MAEFEAMPRFRAIWCGIASFKWQQVAPNGTVMTKEIYPSPAGADPLPAHADGKPAGEVVFLHECMPDRYAEYDAVDKEFDAAMRALSEWVAATPALDFGEPAYPSAEIAPPPPPALIKLSSGPIMPIAETARRDVSDERKCPLPPEMILPLGLSDDMLDSVKQLSFYTDCYGETGRWSEPSDAVDPKFSVSILATARMLNRQTVTTERELELWATIVGPHYDKPTMIDALLEFQKQVFLEGLSPTSAEEMEAFVTGRPVGVRD